MNSRNVLPIWIVLFVALLTACGGTPTPTPRITIITPTVPPTQALPSPVPPTSAPIPTATPAASMPSGAPVGKWQITRYAFAPVAAMNKTQADTWLNKTADITANSITFDGKACMVSPFKRSSVSANDYLLAEFKTPPASIGITQEKFDLIQAGCAGSPFNQFIQLNATTLVAFWDGAFFFLAPATPSGVASPTPAPKRISFAAGAITATEQGAVAPNTSQRYVLRVLANQTMTVHLTSAQSQVVLIIWGADGTVLISDHADATTWTGKIPATQDYFISAKSIADTPQNFTLQVIVPPLPTPGADPQPTPKRISFAPGAISATAQGTLAAKGQDRYVLSIQKGQTLALDVASPQGNLYLVVYGVDGTVLISDHVSSPSFVGAVPATQDYIVHVSSYGNASANYTLTITIPPNPTPGPQPTPKRISFAPGATGATVTGILAARASELWQVRAQAGQTLWVNIAPMPNPVFLIIWGADGTVLISDHAGATNWGGKLPTTQDYNIRVVSYGNVPVNYTLAVTIPPR